MVAYPHYLQYEMDDEYSVSEIEMFTRNGNSGGFADFRILLSTDGVNFAPAMNGTTDIWKFDPAKMEYQKFVLTSAVSAKYIKIEMLTSGSGNDFTFLSEFRAYGLY